MDLAKPHAVKVSVSQKDSTLFITLQNGDITVGLTNIGCAITTIQTPDRNNVTGNIVANFNNLELYKINKDYFGCVIGRYANRITNGIFTVDGVQYQLPVNDPPNHLHGGILGFSRRLWTLTGTIENANECGAVFSYFSPDGEEGYPGNLHVTVKYVLRNNNRLHILYKATTDKSTPVNLSNHSYFNLTGFHQPTVLEHHLQVMGDSYTEKSANNTSSGTIAQVHNTALDFINPKRIGDDIKWFPREMGYDHNFILNDGGKKNIIKAAVLSEHSTGRMLTVYTDQPGIQVYTANFWDGTVDSGRGFTYQKHGGVALETQSYPDSVNHRHFPDTILNPGEEYTSVTVYEFGITA